MSDRKQFDDHMKQAFGDFSPDVPPHIWQNITDKRKNKKPFAFWLNKRNLVLLGTVLVVCCGAGLLILQHNKPDHFALENNGNNRQQAAEKAAPAAVLQDKAREENAAGTSSPLPLVAGINIENRDVIAASAATETNVKKRAQLAAPVAQEKNSSRVAHRRPTGIHDNIITDNANDLFRNRDKKLQSKKSSLQIKQSVSLVDNAVFGQAGNDAPVDNDVLPDEFHLPYVQGGKDYIQLVSTAHRNNKQLVLTAIHIPDCPAAEKDAAGNKSYVEVYAGPDYAFKKYSDTGNSVLVNKRKESLAFQSAFSAGIRYTKVFGNGMSIRAGINYSQINEKFSFIKDNVVQLIYVISPAGDTTDSYYVRGTRYKTSYNHYRTIDVPIVVGYELGNGRLHANINAGVMVNIYSWQKGETLDNNLLPVSISTGKEGDPAYQYKTNAGIGFTGAISLYYKLNDRLHILAEPYCRFNLSPMNKEAASLQEKFNTIGLRLGLRLDLK